MKHILVKRPNNKVTLVRSQVEIGNESELTEHEQIINELYNKVENLYLQLVSKQRELLIAFVKKHNEINVMNNKIWFQEVDDFLSNL